jgi:hypothetical protein
MRPFLFATLSMLLWSATSLAQPAPPPTEEPHPEPRLRAGVGAILGFRIEGPNESGDGGLGLYLRGGVQLSDLLGIEDDIAALNVPLPFPTLLVRDTLDLTVTPVDWLTVASGPTGSWGIVESAWTLGGMLRVDFHLPPQQRRPSGIRRAPTLGVAGDLGGVVKRDGPAGGAAWGTYVTFGYAWY